MALLAGVGIAVQPPTNAALARASGSVLLAALVSFSIGTAALLLVWLAVERGHVGGIRAAPTWAWFGGLYGAFFVASAAFAAPRLGLGVTLTLMIASQLVAALVVDRFGLLGLQSVPLSTGRVMGVVLVLAGVVLVRRG